MLFATGVKRIVVGEAMETVEKKTGRSERLRHCRYFDASVRLMTTEASIVVDE